MSPDGAPAAVLGAASAHREGHGALVDVARVAVVVNDIVLWAMRDNLVCLNTDTHARAHTYCICVCLYMCVLYIDIDICTHMYVCLCEKVFTIYNMCNKKHYNNICITCIFLSFFHKTNERFPKTISTCAILTLNRVP